MRTHPFRFEGRALQINFSTSAAGEIRMELQDRDGEPIQGFTLADCDLLIGDEIDRTVTWKGEDNVGSLAGRVVRLHVALKDADLYSIRFRP